MTANNINILMECLKNTYIKMYSDNVYLLEMDKYVINHIEQRLNSTKTVIHSEILRRVEILNTPT